MNCSVEFRNYCCRYRDDQELVLKDINLRIEHGERVGVVGRTGAGKSTLAQALFRLVESDGGAIYVDGEDVGKLELAAVRRAVAVVPQQPALFNDTVRFNLDPFDLHDDDDIWRALEACHLQELVGAFAERLQHVLGDHGDNVSVGQKQLLCLARVVLRKPRILVFDEATACKSEVAGAHARVSIFNFLIYF